MNETVAKENAGTGRGFLSRPVVVTAAGGLLLALVALGVGYGLGGGRGEGAAPEAAGTGQKKVRFWTCSMHPQIKQPEKGQCPICAMDLIPVYEGAADDGGGPRRMVMSEAAKALAEIRTAPVEKKFVEARVRMVGKVDYDETRVQHITAWFPGRLDRLYVDYTGIPVKKGDHLVYIYSPQLLSAQEELIQAKKAYADALKGSSKFMKESSKATLEAAREKLRLWGLSIEQIAAVEKAGKARDHMTIYSPQSGIVITKHLNQGAYVKTGTRIYTVADLSRVWVRLDAYEADREWIRYGQDVEFTTEAYPGRVFRGKITFIDPILDARTRTIRLRVIADNSDGRLQPGMFVRATVRPRVAAGGKVMDPSLAGKWISPMHPEVVKDGPGKCDVCGMPLVRAEDMGYVSPKSEAPLVIPASAPLITGTRAVVYVRDAEAKRPTFEGREIVLGPRAGDYYVVRAGLKEGERVVVNGSFKIDSALQIEARPSMMSPAGGASGGGHQHGAKHASSSVLELAAPEAFRAQLNAVLVEYLKVQEALSGDSAKEAAAAAAALAQKLSTVDMKLLEGEAHVAWMGDLKALSAGVKHLARAGEIKKQREVFATLSEAMAAAVRRFHPAAGEVFVMKCPMAFGGRGASWLQNDKAVRNPYFGAAMLKCGEVIATIGKAGKSPAKSQSTCPVMGGKINRKLFADHGGKRVYFCCPGCKPEFRKDPERYLKKLRDAGVKLEDAPVPASGKPEGRHGH